MPQVAPKIKRKLLTKRPLLDSTATTLPDVRWFNSVRKNLSGWFVDAARDLPWRRTRDPYAIWVSEIMLQQTTVATVTPKYMAFMAAFPTVEKLAQATEQQVMKQWEGLGYYRRARNLHAAAKQIVAQHQNIFPRDMADIQALPGIGRYTAGAISSIAFDSPMPILEANTFRVWARLLCEERPIVEKNVQERLWHAAEAILPRGAGSGQINQALMELGSRLCTPTRPLCKECPVKNFCQAALTKRQDKIPHPVDKKKFQARHEAAVMVRQKNEWLLVRYAPGQRWAGLWDLPRVLIDETGQTAMLAPNNKTSQAKLIANTQTALQKLLGLKLKLTPTGLRLNHVVTRYKITLDVWSAKVPASSSVKIGKKIDHQRIVEARWVKQSELEHFPLPTTARKIIRHYA